MFRCKILAVLKSVDQVSYLYLNRLKVVHNLVVIRSLRSKRIQRVPNPGLEERLEIFDFKDKDNISQEELDEIDREPDVLRVKLNRHDFEREEEKAKHYVRVKLLEKKYFKQKREPALLTWEEREQIRNLHDINPDKWNVHTLAESFPATESVIKKVLESSWRPDTQAINRYNNTVTENWKKLYEGKLNISGETKDHLSRFSSREKGFFSPAESNLVYAEKSNIVPISTEFSDLVKKHNPQELLPDPLQNTKQDLLQNSIPNAPDDDTYVIDGNKKKGFQRLSTLEMYREKVLKSSKPLDPIDRALVESYKTNMMKHQDLKEPLSSSDFCIPKYKEMVELKSEQSGKKVIRDYIKIPPHLKGKGSLYKLDDCYYDGDGELLYRVPGMG